MEKKPKILVVDDDDDLVAILQTLFTSAGYEVISASSAKDAIDIAPKVNPDLVVLDVMMEDLLAGLRVARYLRGSELAHIPILMLTSIHMRSDTQFRTESAGLFNDRDSFLEKPVGLDRLLEEVQRVLKPKSIQE